MLGKKRPGPIDVERPVYIGGREKLTKLARVNTVPNSAYRFAFFTHKSPPPPGTCNGGLQ